LFAFENVLPYENGPINKVTYWPWSVQPYNAAFLNLLTVKETLVYFSRIREPLHKNYYK
jgi:hypothetical protein